MSGDVRLAKPSDLSRAALRLGVLAVLVSAVAGLWSYRASRAELLDTICEANLRLAHALAAHSDAHGSRGEILSALERDWLGQRERAGGYLCVVDLDGRLLLHTKRPETVGKDVGWLELPGQEAGEPRTLSELALARGEWVGVSQNSAGERYLAAYVFDPELEALVAIHVDAAEVEGALLRAALPWASALAFVVLVLLPLSLFGLHRASRTAQAALADALQARLDAAEERRRLEARAVETRKMEALGRLASGVAHDFNTIVLSIQGFAELARDELPEECAARAKLEQVLVAAGRAKALVLQISTFGRRAPRPSLEALALEPLVEEVLALVRPTLPSGARLERELGPVPPVEGDADQLHQLLLNLVTNAVQALPSGEGRVQVALRRRMLEGPRASALGLLPGEHVELEVQDDGVGMDEETRARAFEPFFTTKPLGEGTGLGLAVVQGVLRALGGAIELESRPGRGTRARVFLRRAVQAPLPSRVPEREPPRLIAREGRILVVDDEEALVELVVAQLERWGLAAVGCTGPRAALERLGAAPRAFDLLLVDAAMPELDGFELARQARELAPDLHVILVTGSAPGERRLAESAIERVLAKPYTTEELFAAIDEVLGTPA